MKVVVVSEPLINAILQNLTMQPYGSVAVLIDEIKKCKLAEVSEGKQKEPVKAAELTETP